MAQKKDNKKETVQSKQPTAGEGAATSSQSEQCSAEAAGSPSEQSKVKITTEDFDKFEATCGEIHIKFGESSHAVRCDVKRVNIFLVSAVLDDVKQHNISQFMANITPENIVNVLSGIGGIPIGIII